MNYCRKCQSDYEKPGTCNCFAERADLRIALDVAPAAFPAPPRQDCDCAPRPVLRYDVRLPSPLTPQAKAAFAKLIDGATRRGFLS